MTIDTKDILNSILASISRIDYIKPDEIPGIDLYMDQVTTFMENHLSCLLYTSMYSTARCRNFPCPVITSGILLHRLQESI